MSRWVWVAISDAIVTGRDQDGDPEGAKLCKFITNMGSILVWICLWLEYDNQGMEQSTYVLGVAIADGDRLREIFLGQHMFQPLESTMIEHVRIAE